MYYSSSCILALFIRKVCSQCKLHKLIEMTVVFDYCGQNFVSIQNFNSSNCFIWLIARCYTINIYAYLSAACNMCRLWFGRTLENGRNVKNWEGFRSITRNVGGQKWHGWTRNRGKWNNNVRSFLIDTFTKVICRVNIFRSSTFQGKINHMVYLRTIIYWRTKESRRGQHRGTDKSPTKKKKHKKKQDKPKKIPKISQEDMENLTKIKTEVFESESLLDPTSGTIVEAACEKSVEGNRLLALSLFVWYEVTSTVKFGKWMPRCHRSPVTTLI